MATSTGYSSNAQNNHRLAIALALILSLALGLRLANLGGRNLWYDEAFAVLFAEKGVDAMLYGTLEPVAGGASDIHPLLYYSTLNIWMGLFGQNAFVVRLWSVLVGVATAAMMFALGRELFDYRAGLAAALITAIAPFHVQYSQEARMYALLGLLLMAATWCFVRGWRAVERDASGWQLWCWWLAFGVVAGLAMYTQQLAAFYLVALALVPVLARRADQSRWVLAGGVIAIIVYLPWLVNLPGQLSKVRAYYWLSPPNVAQPLLTVRSFLTVNLDYPPPAALIGFLGALFVVLFLVIQIVMSRRHRRSVDRWALRLALWLAVGPPALMWLVSQVQPVYLERALLPSALMLYLALAWLFTGSGLPRPIVGLVGAVGLVLMSIGLYYQYTWATFPNSPFGPAATYIHDNWQDGDRVVHQSKLTALPMVYYERELDQRFIGDTPGSPQDTLALPTQEALRLLADACVQAASGASQRVWWVTFDFAGAQYETAGRPELREAQAWLNSHYRLVNTQGFNDLEVSLYANPDTRETDCT